MYIVTAREVNKAMVEVLSKRVYLPGVSAEAIGVETVASGQFFRFNLRMNKNYKVLPSIERAIKTSNETGQLAEGSKYLMLGAVQIAGDKIRATARIVVVETSVMERAAKGDSELSYEGLCKAFEEALRNLLISYVA